MYRVSLFDLTGQTKLLTFSSAQVKGWSKRINAAGRMQFSLPYGDTQATAANLQKYKRVRLYRNGTVVWYGYIEAHKRQGNEISVFCAGMLDFFRKRLTANNQAFTGQGSTEAFTLLAAANIVGNTGISAGTGGVTTTRSVTAQGYSDVLKAWELLAQAHGAEFEITDSGLFNFVPLLGSTKSITLTFNRNGLQGSNVLDTEEGEDGQPVVNQLYAETTGGGGLSYTANDLTSQGIYGILQGTKQFNEAQNIGTLTAMAQQEASQTGNPITDYRIVPIMASKSFHPVTGTEVVSGIEYGDIVVGDLVNVVINSENETTDEAKRIAEIVVEVDESLNEKVRYTLSKSGVFVTASLLDMDEVGRLKRRVSELEALI